MSNGACKMNGSALYTEIEQNCNRHEKHDTTFYMMNHFLYSRLDGNYPTNTEFYDEDVNVYIANLLTSLSNSYYHETLRRHVIPYDIPLNKKVESLDSEREKYLYYRINADFLTLSTGLFGNPRMRRPGSASHMALPERSYIGRAKIYYRLAYSHLCRTSGNGSSLADVLDKLADGLENYIRILSVMKVEYLNLRRCLSDGEVFHLQRSILNVDREKNLKDLHNLFLDLYSEYRRRGGSELKKKIESVVDKIKLIDPDFSFSID
jgi:hypothetical protein